MSELEQKAWYVYIVECADHTYYTGVTINVERRAQEHNSKNKGARYTRSRQPVSVVYTENADDRASACKREYEIKKMTRRNKIKLIQSKIK